MRTNKEPFNQSVVKIKKEVSIIWSLMTCLLSILSTFLIK